MAIEISDIIGAAGGEIVGKIRLQKMIYLLEQLGLESGFSFDYHHYGPYSSDLSDDADFNVVLENVVEETRRRVSDGVPYSVFKVPENWDSEASEKIGGLPTKKVEPFLSYLQEQSGTVLELAATIHWLAFVEKVEDWREELLRRKGSKAAEGRTEKALAILKELNISPA